MSEQDDSVDISLVVVQFNGEDLLRDCLRSLPAACEGLSWEAIVVDNASTDRSVDVVRDEFPEVKLIANQENLGFTRANNQGLAIARGRYLVLLNNDTEAKPRAFSDAVVYLDQHEDIGAAGLKLLNRDGSRQLSCRRFPGFQQALFNRYSLLTKLFPNNPISQSYLMSDLDAAEDAVDVDWVSGACLIFRRDLFEKIGGLDERFFMYSEDVDFCLRVWQADRRVSFLPFAEVFHYIGQSTAHFPFMPLIQRHRSMYQFYKKHYSRELLFLDLATLGMVTVRCAIQLVSLAFKRLGRSRPAGGATSG